MVQENVSQFLMELGRDNPDRKPDAPCKADMAYSFILECWKSQGKPPGNFSTDDPWFVEFSDEITEHFGLKVVSSDEGQRINKEVREKARLQTRYGFAPIAEA